MKFMFFRRERPHDFTFQERMENVRKAGFTVEPGSRRAWSAPAAGDMRWT